uniref:type II toxin-antitoxin system VapC family toxin n=1 Tax=uncultured Sphingomonas sp. TaxID=158754 RepID=UPI0025E2D8FF|nr:type II toxin-antitoxin system VapC family toxin [uncultured Sphingomonas sp.]
MILADTHVLVWLASGDRRLPASGRELLFEEGFAISVVTAWEYADLLARGRLATSATVDWIVEEFSAPIAALPKDCWSLSAKLPPVHRDPVDRMLVAHTLVAGGTLATADKKMRRYPVPLAW